MGRFDHLKQMEVTEASRSRFPVPALPGAVLILAPATAALNKEIVRWSMQNPEHSKALQDALDTARADDEASNRDILDIVRDNDRRLYAEVICKGWEKMPDEDGKDTKFSKGAAKDFFEQVPDWIFDDVRQHAQIPTNFHKAWKPRPQLRDVAGNS